MIQETDKPKRGRPATGQTPMRYLRMRDDDWQQIEAAAEAMDETMSAYLRRIALKDTAKVLKARGS